MLSPPYTDGMAHATDAKPCEQSAPWPDAAYPAWSSTHVLTGDAGGGNVGGGGDGGVEGSGDGGGVDGGGGLGDGGGGLGGGRLGGGLCSVRSNDGVEGQSEIDGGGDIETCVSEDFVSPDDAGGGGGGGGDGATVIVFSTSVGFVTSKTMSVVNVIMIGTPAKHATTHL